MPHNPNPAQASSRLLLALAALLATLPLFLHGYSCGHDFDFHLQSWVDAAQQFCQGTIYPRWTFSAAYNAGEPRFLFYPPLSWMLGALLTLLFPIVAVPAIYVFLALAAAGLAMHHLSRQFVSPHAALLASAFYLANPYMLFNAFERAAYAELLSAAWIPLLFLAVLRARPTVIGIAIPVTLLWLTNAPAAVMGCYTLAVLTAIRLVPSIVLLRFSRGPRRFLATTVAGTLLGLALPAFYLIPAAYERRYVQIALAIVPNSRFEDNFLFWQTADESHNEILHTASLLAVALLVLTAAATSTLLVLRRSQPAGSSAPEPAASLPATLLILATLIAGMLVPISTPLWRFLPELAFLQFPWRLLTILSAVLAFAAALLLDQSCRTFGKFSAFAAPGGALALSLLGLHLYRQPCDTYGRPQDVLRLFATHHGVLPTSEYTPNGASNDILRSDNPAYWLSPDPASFAPGTVPNPSLANPTFFEDNSIPLAQTVSAPAPEHLTLNLPRPEILILNLRDFPAWRLARNGQELRAHIPRADGLLAVGLPSGPSTIDLTWRRTLDEKLGLAVSGGALLVLLGIFLRRTPAPPAVRLLPCN